MLFVLPKSILLFALEIIKFLLFTLSLFFPFLAIANFIEVADLWKVYYIFISLNWILKTQIA